MTTPPEHPMQPVVRDEHGTYRFHPNAIVRYLIDLCRAKGICDMNMLAILPFSAEDHMQFAQLIGYSVHGFGELSYVSEDAYVVACAEIEKLKATEK